MKLRKMTIKFDQYVTTLGLVREIITINVINDGRTKFSDSGWLKNMW